MLLGAQLAEVNMSTVSQVENSDDAQTVMTWGAFSS